MFRAEKFSVLIKCKIFQLFKLCKIAIHFHSYYLSTWIKPCYSFFSLLDKSHNALWIVLLLSDVVDDCVDIVTCTAFLLRFLNNVELSLNWMSVYELKWLFVVYMQMVVKLLLIMVVFQELRGSRQEYANLGLQYEFLNISNHLIITLLWTT